MTLQEAPTERASQRNDDRSSRPQNPKSRTTLVPSRSASRASQISRPSSTSRFPSASLSPNSGIIQASGVSRSAACSEASALARTVLPAPGRPTIRNNVATEPSCRKLADPRRRSRPAAAQPAAESRGCIVSMSMIRPSHRHDKMRAWTSLKLFHPVKKVRPMDAGIRFRSRALRVSAGGEGAATTSDEPRQQDGPTEPDRGTAPVAGSYLARSDPTGERTHLQMPGPDATPGRFETQQIHRDRAQGRVGIASSRCTELPTPRST